MSLSTKTGKAAIQQWCQEVTGEQVPDFTTCFENGVLFLKIIHHYKPELVDISKIDPKKKIQTLIKLLILQQINLILIICYLQKNLMFQIQKR